MVKQEEFQDVNDQKISSGEMPKKNRMPFLIQINHGQLKPVNPHKKRMPFFRTKTLRGKLKIQEREKNALTEPVESRQYISGKRLAILERRCRTFRDKAKQQRTDKICSHSYSAPSHSLTRLLHFQT